MKKIIKNTISCTSTRQLSSYITPKMREKIKYSNI